MFSVFEHYSKSNINLTALFCRSCYTDLMVKEQYELYLRSIYKKRDGNPLSPSSFQHYAGEAVRKINELIKLKTNGEYESIYEIPSLDELLRCKDLLLTDDYFRKLDTDGNRMYSAGFNRYLEFAQGYCFNNIEDKINLLDMPIPAKERTIIRDKKVPTRNRIAVLHAEKAFSYRCQINPKHETFLMETTEKPYVEGHHIIPLSMQDKFSNSLDCYANILVLCPTCHRFLHFGRTCEKEKILDSVYEERSERYTKSGLDISHNEFVSLITEKTTYYSY